MKGVDLAAPEEWPAFLAEGIRPCLVHGPGGFLPPAPGSAQRFGPSLGWSDAALHGVLLEQLDSRAAAARAAGLDHLVSLFGDCNARSETDNLDNCIRGLRAALPILEQYDVKLSLEVLNSRIDHPGYFADHMALGAEICTAVASPRVGLLCDLYHLQVMDEDPLKALQRYAALISHVHLGAAPGRRAPGPGQTLDWQAVFATLEALGYTGWIGHEWLPRGVDPLAELEATLRWLAPK